MTDLQASQKFQSAVRAFRAGELGPAEAICREIVGRNRKDAEAWLLLGEIAQRRNLFDESARCFRQCVSLRPKAALAHVRLGQALHHLGRHRDALGRLDKALKLEPGLVAAVAARASVYMTQGRYEKARDMVAPVHARNRAAELAVVLAELELHLGDPEKAIAVAAPHIDDESVAAGLRYRLGATLGKSYERSGDYDRAFAAFERGNGAVPSTFDPKRHAARIDEVIDAYSAERLARLPRSTVDSELPIFIVGMPRSGSTLVDRIIDAHPAAFGADETSIVFDRVQSLGMDIGSTLPYPDCVADLEPEDVDRLGREDLERLAKLAPSATRIADKNLLNILHLGLIALLLPRARVIHCRRNPLDTCVSCYAEPLEPTVYGYATGLASLGMAYRQYDRIARHWRDVLDLPILELSYEDLVEDPEGQTRRIVDFCGLPWDDACLRYHETGRSARTLSHAQVRRPIYQSSVARWQRFAAHLDPLREALGDLAAPPRSAAP